MFDNAQDNSQHPLVLWVGRRPKVAMAAGLAIGALVIALLLSTVHHGGVPMLTPGKKATPFTQAAIERVNQRLQTALAWAHPSAATLQAEARG